MRLIDADTVDFGEVFKGQSNFAKDTRDAAYGLIIAQPTVCRWIPVTERLPDEPDTESGTKEYNVTIFGAAESTTLAYIGHGEWYDEQDNSYNVLAWMPLPEAYKPEN